MTSVMTPTPATGTWQMKAAAPIRVRVLLGAVIGAFAGTGAGLLAAQAAVAAEESGAAALRDAQAFYRQGQYFKAARYAFNAKQLDQGLSAEANSWITLGLMRARLYNSATYFFINTLQTGDSNAIRRVLTQTQDLIVHVGPDIVRKFLVKHTRYEDYDSPNRSAYLYALGKEALLSSAEDKAVGYVNAIPERSALWPFALQIRAAARAIQGKGELAVEDFELCARRAFDSVPEGAADELAVKQARLEAEDLQARCMAGKARTLYQMERFDEADQAYDRISKFSFVWPDILFEQAWNSFARREYNRALGKLVSYKSPALAFVFNPEVDVLRAQTFLGLCLYSEANDVINEFNGKHARVGEQVKRLLEQGEGSLENFYSIGKEALFGPLYTGNEVHKMANRFVRSPYFQGLVRAESGVESEKVAIRRFDATQAGVAHDPSRGFPGFLEQVLRWRRKSIGQLGGAFVKNSLIDYHSALIADFDKMSFIKLEMLKRAKEQLMSRKGKGSATSNDRSWGNVAPSRRHYQYYWSFNGEFWNDELGDYVFGLESECRGGEGA